MFEQPFALLTTVKPEPEPPATNLPTTSAFDDINLDDSVPKLDLTFGTSTTKGIASTFGGFGGWTGGWGASNRWGTDGADVTSPEATETVASKDTKHIAADLPETNKWSFGGNTKNKQKTTTSSFGFADYGALDEIEVEPQHSKIDEPVKSVEEDEWGGGFKSVNQKGKKNKKKGIEVEPSKDNDTPVIEVSVVEDANFADDSVGAWGKKKGQKSKASDTPVVPPPPPAAPAPPAADEEWEGFSGKKDKKKSKKGGVDEAPKIEKPIAPVVPEPEIEADIGWGAIIATKGKKKGKKGGTDEPPKIEDPIDPIVPEAEVEVDNSWGAFTMTKSKKKTKKGQEEEITEVEDPAIVAVPEVEPTAVNGWGTFGAKKGKNKGTALAVEEPAVNGDLEPDLMEDEGWDAFSTKKKKKNDKKEVVKDTLALGDAANDTDPAPEPFRANFWGAPSTKKESAADVAPEPEPGVDDGWGTFPSKNNKKKGKKGAADGVTRAEAPTAVVVPETNAAAGDLWDSWGKEAKENNTTGISVIEDEPIVDVVDFTAEPTTTTFDDDWTAGGSGKKKEKKADKTKRGTTAVSKADESIPPAPPPAGPLSVATAIGLFDSPTNAIMGTLKKDLAKKGKKGQTISPEPIAVTTSEPVVEEKPEPVEDDWGSSWVGLSNKDKKKKEKEKKEKEEKERKEREEEKEKMEREENEKKERDEKERGKKEKEAEKKKGGKKGVIELVEEPKVSDLMTGSVAEVAPESSCGSWGGAKKDNKKKASKKDHAFEAPPPPAPTPPVMGLTPEPEAVLEDAAEDDWGSFAPAKIKGGKTKKETLPRTTAVSKPNDIKDSKVGGKSTVDKSMDFFSTLDKSPVEEAKADAKKETPREETPAKAARSFWGGMSSTAVPKGKIGKEKEKEKEREEEEERARENVEMVNPMDYMDEIVDVVEEPPPKKEKGSKLTKASIKESDKAGKADDKKKKKNTEVDPLIDIAEEPPAQWSDTSKGGKDTKGKIDNNTNDAINNKKDESWMSSFWSPSEKTGGKKGDEAKKEIGRQDSTKTANQNVDLFSLNDLISKEPEVAAADESLQPSKTSKLTTASKMSASKANTFATTSKTLSVSEKVKALEKERLKKSETKFTAPPPPPPAPEPLPQADLTPKKVSALSKTKASSATKTATLNSLKKKEPSPPPKDDHKASKDSVPGSFPSEGAEDDIIGFIDLPPTDKKIKKKAVKAAKPEPEPEPELKMDDYLVEAPAPPAPPTPPPEPAVISKPVKKERARVVRDEGVSSWGFWGAAPKKEIKKDRRSKDDADATSPPSKEKAPAPGLSRSKSTRIPREKEKEELSRSSGSEKIKKAESRPPKSRGASFSGLFGGPSPARAKSTRRPSAAGPRSSSRQQSVDARAYGMPSPPPDDQSAMNDKAARFLGRQPSTRGKQKGSGNVISSV